MIVPNSVLFRKVLPEDCEALVSFFIKNAVPQVTNTFTAFPLTRTTAEWISRTEHKDGYYLLLVDQQIAGLSMLRGFDEGFTIPSFGIMIGHQYQNKGYGKQLLAYTIDQAKEMGCSKVRLSVFGQNASGRKIYQAIGFYEVERTPIIMNGISDVKIIMVKDL